MKRKLLSLILIILPTVLWADAVEVDGISYTLNANLNEAEVTARADKYSGDIIIPESIEYENTVYKVTSIGNRSFSECTDLTSVAIGHNVNHIGEFAFCYCNKLSTISIGKAVSVIGSKAFANVGSAAQTRGDGGLKVSCYAESVPTTASDAFENTPISNATLLVDDNSVAAYKTAAPWSGFGNIMGFNEAAGIEDVLYDNGGKVKIFSIDGKPLNEPQKGINIIRMDNGKTQKVIVK